MTSSHDIGLNGGTRAQPFEHAVQFYEDESFLYDVVAEFIAAGLMAFEPVVVIAEPRHRDAFSTRLSVKGFDLEDLCREGHLRFCDARETLALFMNADRLPDAARCSRVIGGLLEGAAAGRQRQVRVYGEMVDVLWREGAAEAAIRLEKIWNELAQDHAFSLLCAYPIANFYRQSHAAGFEAICAQHGTVTPTEATARDDREALLRTIAVLQQRDVALRTEIGDRIRLEHALREALHQRWDTEEALRRKEAELEDFVDHATVAMHWVGEDGTILWVNDEELRLVGYAREEYVGRNIAEFHADRQVIDEILAILKGGGEIRDRRARLLAKDGSIRHVAISSNVLFEEGRFVHTRCFTRDITAQTRLEEERAFLLDAATVLGRSLDSESRLRELAALIVPRLSDWCAVDVAGEDGAKERIATAGIPPADGATLTVAMTTGDRVLGWLTLGRHWASEELALELARRAAIAIENSRLYRLAQEGSRAKDAFLATLSHELRTPLTAILGWARMLRLGPLDPGVTAKALETIERSATAQAALIDDIFDLSNAVGGKMTLQIGRVDLVAVAAAAIESLRVAASAKDIRIELHPPEGPLFVTGDGARLQQIAWNLLSNAIKFSAQGGTVRLEIEATTDQTRLIVRDEGRGIGPEFLPHVFEAFRQADPATTRTHGGLGIGLAIVKSLVELHGGSIAADSAGEGLGAAFTVTLAGVRPEVESVAAG